MCRKYFPSRVPGHHVGDWFVPIATVYADLSITTLYTSWARPLSAHWHGTVRPISWRSVNLDFYPLYFPPHPMGSSSLSERTRGVTVQGSGDDSSNACGSTVSIWRSWIMLTLDKLSGSHLWLMTCVALSLDIISDRSVALSSVHFLHKYHTLLFSFLYFPLKHTVRVIQSSLSVVVSVINALPPFTYWLGKYLLFHKSLLPSDTLFIFLDFIHPLPLLDPSES